MCRICIAPVLCGIPVSDCDVRRYIKHAIIACVASKQRSGKARDSVLVSGRHSTRGWRHGICHRGHAGNGRNYSCRERPRREL